MGAADRSDHTLPRAELPAEPGSRERAEGAAGSAETPNGGHAAFGAEWKLHEPSCRKENA